MKKRESAVTQVFTSARGTVYALFWSAQALQQDQTTSGKPLAEKLLPAGARTRRRPALASNPVDSRAFHVHHAHQLLDTFPLANRPRAVISWKYENGDRIKLG